MNRRLHPLPSPRHTARPAVALAMLATGILAAGCTTSAPASSGWTAGAANGASGANGGGTVVVFAAASLKESFTTLAADFEASHPGVRVRLNFGPSSGLAAQLLAGAPADVFASASQKNMDQVATGGLAMTPVVFATNVMAVALPSANPGRIAALADLARADVKVAVCQPVVPCGVGASRVFAKAGVQVRPVTLEADVKAVLTKVQLGEVDAGIVYASDLHAAGDKVKGLDIAADLNYSTAYPIATLAKAANPTAAAYFVALVTSAEGRRVLRSAGFGSS